MAIGFDADEYVAGLTDAQRYNIDLYGANLATYEERKAVGDAIDRYKAANRVDSTVDSGGLSLGGAPNVGGSGFSGIFSDGSSTSDAGSGTNVLAPPEGASDPLPGGPGIQDWTSPGVTDWGGENVTTEALEDPNTIEPEEDVAPDWLDEREDIPVDWDRGQKIEPEAPEFGPDPRDMDWDWGRFGVQTDTGGFGQYFPNYDSSARYTPGKDSPWGSDRFPGNNRDFYQNQFGNLLRQEQGFQKAQRQSAARQEEARANPLESMPLDWSWTELPEVDVMDNGYASPIPGMEFGGEEYGYQEGGAAYRFDPVTGEFIVASAGGPREAGQTQRN